MSSQILLFLPLIYTFCFPLALWPLRGVGVKVWASIHICVLTLLALLALYWLPGNNEVLSLIQNQTTGLSFTLWAPTWTLIFLALIWLIGALILAYSLFYFEESEDELKRCLALLSLFLASMQGLVCAENLMLTFIFWELTTLTSFLLIGHYYEQESARTSAKRALYLTGAGGLAMLLGLILIWAETGTLSMSELMNSRPLLSPLALCLVLAGVITKSAQFPAHFWLPGAMAAPTPISAYLHSATMVKAGLFVFGMLAPIIYQSDTLSELQLPLTLIAGITALWGGLCALGQRDLKSLLAYTTVSALGMIFIPLIQASNLQLSAAALFIIVHALYKGGLFMLIGWVDHSFHTRLIDKLGGVQKTSRVAQVIAIGLCFSMAALPLSLGYLSKEILYTNLLNTNNIGLGFLLLASALNCVCAYRIYWALFIQQGTPEIHHQNDSLLIMPGILSALGIGLSFLEGPLTSKILNPLALEEIHLAWIPHHLSIALLTALTFGLAIIFIAILSRTLWAKGVSLPKIKSLESLFDMFMEFNLKQLSKLSNLTFHGAHHRHLSLGLVGILSFLSMGIYLARDQIVLPELTEDPEVWELALFTLMALPAAAIPFIQGRVSALLVGGASGLGICLTFALYSAPDLALTQLMVETLVLVMFVYSVQKLPNVSLSRSFNPHYKGISLALIFASVVTIVVSTIHAGMTEEKIWSFFAENSYLLANGKNVVNVILVDFRALDTMGEITVLSLACVGVYALLKPKIERRGETIGRDNIWTVKIALKLLTPLILALSIYILIRGHNSPGGGFIGGLVAGIALILPEREPKLSTPFFLVFSGLSLSLISGVIPLIFGLPLFKGIWGVELFANFKLSNVFFFDLGVYILVVGMVILISRLLASNSSEVRP